MRRTGRAALARADVHLAGRDRVAARGPQGREGSPSRHQPPPAGPRTNPGSLFASPRLVHLLGSEPPWRTDPVETSSGATFGTTQQPPSRFLKQKAGGPTEGGQRVGPSLAPQRGLCATSKVRPSPVLRRVAQIESKIQSRKARWEEAAAEAGRLPAFMDMAELSLSESSGHDAAERGGGHRRSTKAVAGMGGDGRTRTSQLTRASLGDPTETTEGLGLPRKGWIQASAKISSGSGQRLLPGNNPLKRDPQTSTIPPSQRASLPPASRGGTPSSSPSLQGNLSGEPATRGSSPCELVRSLDELFSEGGNAHGSDDNASSSGSDFQVNILSLDDLAPIGHSQDKEEETKEEGKASSGKPKEELGAALAPAALPSLFHAPKPISGKGLAWDEEAEEMGEMEISEQLGGPSAALPSSSGDNETPPMDAEYSEDFELPSSSSSSSLSSSFVASAEGAGRPPTSLEESQSHSEASLHSSRSASSFSEPPCGSPGSTKPSGRQRTFTEVAVQTSSFPLLPQFLQTDSPILGFAIGGENSVDALPIGSPALSLDVIEALTVYSPAAFALNELLKENLVLIRQFVEANRRLHASIVASLEEEEFHYHTLEEAKRYISSHKAPLLTMAQALRETEAQEEAAV